MFRMQCSLQEGFFCFQERRSSLEACGPRANDGAADLRAAAGRAAGRAAHRAAGVARAWLRFPRLANQLGLLPGDNGRSFITASRIRFARVSRSRCWQKLGRFPAKLCVLTVCVHDWRPPYVPVARKLLL